MYKIRFQNSPNVAVKTNKNIIKIMKKFFEKEGPINFKGISKIPTLAYIVGIIFILPAILLFIIMFVVNNNTPASIGIILLEVIFFLVTVVIIAFKRIRDLVVTGFTKPVTITIGFLISSFFIVQNDFSMFTPEEGPIFKSALPFAVFMWLLFPIIQSNWFVKKVPKWLLWIIRIPVWIIVFFTTTILLEISAVNLFGHLG